MMLALMPHGYCFLWNRSLTLMHVLADVAIAGAYLSIPIMMFLQRHRVTARIRPLLILFAAFILSCGIGHTLSAWNIWHGDYWIEGGWKVVTATISIWTALELTRQFPFIMGLQQRLEDTEQLAYTDALTGLKNRHGLKSTLQNVQSAFENRPVNHVLMVMDVDNFKCINDRFGHAVGDRVLQGISQILSEQTRAVDTVARLGGDEFAVILVGCTADRGQIIAENIRAAVARLNILPQDAPHPACQSWVTISIGLALIDEATTFEQAYQAADTALYRCKNAGRNRICQLNPPIAIA